ncbi:hypothetical protein AMTRI_Chr11g95770 [Amborella trichopoda]
MGLKLIGRALSHEILRHILSLLPIRETRRTSILFKRWSDLWASTLFFNNDADPIQQNELDWVTIIDWALILQIGAILGFCLRLQELTITTLQELVIKFYPDKEEDEEGARKMKRRKRKMMRRDTKSKRLLFACSSLVSLNLTSAIGAPKTRGMQRPLAYQVLARNLVFLHIYGDFRNINLNKCSNINKLSVHMLNENDNWGGRLSEYLKGLLRLEWLVLYEWSLWRLPVSNRNVRMLEVPIDLMEEKAVLTFLCLLKSFPCLEVLIDTYPSNFSKVVGDYWKMLDRTESWLGCLKIREIEMIGFFLANVKCLRRFVCGSKKESNYELKNKFEITAQLLLLPRASSQAKAYIR